MSIGLLLAALAVTNVSTVAELKAVASAMKTDTRVVLADGVYDLSEDGPDAASGTFLSFGPRVTLRSASGNPAKCVLLGGGAARPGRALAFASGDSRLEGVTVSNFFAKGSAAACLPGAWSDTTHFSNCVFAALHATGPGGAIHRPSAPGACVRIVDCVFADCVSDRNGGALAASGAICATRCRFLRCRAPNGAGGAGDRITAAESTFEDCASGCGGAGGGAAVSGGRTDDCTFRRCGGKAVVLRDATARRCTFEDCGRVGHRHRFEDCVFRRSGGMVDSTLVNCGIYGGRYPAEGGSSLLSRCVLTNCTVTGVTGGDRGRWNSGVVDGGALVGCVVAGNASARDIVAYPPHQAGLGTELVDTVVSGPAVAPKGKGYDPDRAVRQRRAEAAARAAKLAEEAKRGVHEVFRVDFDDERPRSANGTYGGFWSGSWGDSACLYSLVPGAGGRGQAMRCNLKGMAGGQLQVFSQPWEMWQGSWYRLRFKARGVDHPGFVSVGVRRYGYPWSILGWPSVDFHPTNEWKEYAICKRSQHDVSGGFGILIGLGDVGIVEFDDFVVERLDYDPTEREAADSPNPVVFGNLVPRGSFETKDDNFWLFRHRCGSSHAASRAVSPLFMDIRALLLGHGICMLEQNSMTRLIIVSMLRNP